MDYSKLFINGEWVASNGGHTFEVINPATEQPCAQVIMGTEQDVNQAVSAANNAFKTWSKLSSDERAHWLEKLVDRLKAYRDDMALCISQSMGIPLHLSAEIQVDDPIEILQSYVARTALMDEIKRVGNAHIYKQPIGVCALISPWNYPLNQLMGKLGPALASGCTVVVKPAEQTSLQDYYVAKACEDIGLPKGVFNLVPGTGEEVGNVLSKHKDIQLISFTGSTRAGIQVATNAAPTVKKVIQELGGKSPLIIDEGCDVEAAVNYGIEDVMINTGQTCTAYSRWLVHKSNIDEVTKLAKQKAESLIIGSHDKAFIGPVVNAPQRTRILGYIRKGIEEGATIITGGTEHPEGLETGYYVKPTIFKNVNNHMTIAQEEIFGPVICIIEFETQAQAIQIANDTPYGLATAVYAKDEQTGLKIARQIDAGMVYINGASYNIEAPFGGMKQSGNGREFGDEGLNEYVELKAIHLNPKIY